MAHFLRGKQAGIQNDLSNGMTAEQFKPDDIARYGINSLLSAYAYDPVQSLLAVGTSDSQFGPGQVYVFGQKRVSVTFKLPRRASVKDLQFCANRLVCWGNKNDVSIFNLETKTMVAHYAPPGQATALVTDPGLDYCLIGLSNGMVVAYDLDREAMTAFKIPNLWTQQTTRPRMIPVVSLQFHPKDIGSLLVGYSEGAVIYSFKQNKALKYFSYEIPRGAPGGDANPAVTGEIRTPRMIQAIWHPTGTFILTTHEDGSLVFWDPRDGRIVHARTIEEVDVNMPQSIAVTPGGSSLSAKHPFTKIAWCSKQNPDDTGLLIAGGSAMSNPANRLTWIELGPTPNYQTSSWEALANHFRNTKKIHIIPTPPNTQTSNFVLIPRSSPHHAGAYDPIAILVTLSSGELITLTFPSGYPISPTNQLHVSLSFVHPFVTKISLATVERTRWTGTRELRQQGPKFLLGGVESSKPPKRFEDRNIVLMAHADGTIRIWDAGDGGEIENGLVLQVDLARAVGRWDNINVGHMSMSGATIELSVGLHSGEVVVFRLNRNRDAGKPPPSATSNEGPGKLTDITRRTDPDLREGLLPLTLINEQQGPVTAIKHSDIGFVAAAYESGGITVLDLRGPAIIHTVLINELVGRQRRGTIRGRRTSNPSQEREWATVMEFGVMTLDGDDYSSIALFVGTTSGRVLTFKILPSQSGRYTVQFAGLAQISHDRVTSITPLLSDNGDFATATGSAVAGLQQGKRMDGVIVVTTMTTAHIFKPATAKGASKTFDSAFCDNATVAHSREGCALIGLFGDGLARAFSLPALKDIGNSPINHMDVKRFSDALISKSGDIIGWTGPSEIALMSVWGVNQPLPGSTDLLYDPTRLPVPRPTISNLQWISGTQFITPADLDLLIGGPDRPPSKRMISEIRAQQEQEHQRMREAAKSGRPLPSDVAQDQEGYWSYMQRQLQERTEALGLTGDSIERTAETTSNWNDDINKFIAKQKRQAALGFIGSKLGF